MRAEEFDVVIVGAGAGGAALAQRLAERGLSLCMLERGPSFVPPAEPALPPFDRYAVSPDELPNLNARRQEEMFILEGRGVGGTTVLFSANLLRFAPDDFRRRTLMGEVAGASVADWPLTYDDLEPYYTELERDIGVAGDATANPFEPRRSAPYPAPPMTLDRVGRRCAAAAQRLGWHPYPIPTGIGPHRGRKPCTSCGPCTGFACAYQARWNATSFLAGRDPGRWQLRSCAVVTRLLVDRSGDRVTGVEYLDDRSELVSVSGRAVVLAANAIQTARILLQSADSRHPDGLTNDSGQVGRNLMTHAHEAFFAAGYFPEPTQPTSACTLAIQDFYDTRTSGSPMSITLEPRSLGSREAWLRVIEMRASLGVDAAELADHFTANVVVLNMVEDVAQPQNRVVLSPTLRDSAGQPVPIVHYQPHALDVAASAFAASRGEELLGAAGAASIFRTGAWRGPRLHVCGTCRMGSRPSDSVVDADGRSHRVRNLYVADASVLCTSGGVNPALTVMAVARRTADRMSEHFAQRQL
jgi:choline dehydrogenase-like flavoprotein